MDENTPLFDCVEVPGGTMRFKFLSHFLPLGYKIDKNGLYKRVDRFHGGRWKQISYIPCVVSDVEYKNGSTRLKIKFMTSSGEIREIPVLASYAISPKIAKLLREEGANCISEDGQRLSKYLLDSYMTLQNEARKG